MDLVRMKRERIVLNNRKVRGEKGLEARIGELDEAIRRHPQSPMTSAAHTDKRRLENRIKGLDKLR